MMWHFFCRGFFLKNVLIGLRWVKSNSLALSLGSFFGSSDEFVLLLQFWWLDKPVQFKMIQRCFYGLKVQFVWGTLVQMILKFIIFGFNILFVVQRRVLSSDIFKYLIRPIINDEEMIILSPFIELNQQLIHWKPLHNPSKLKKWQFILRVFWMLTHIFEFFDEKWWRKVMFLVGSHVLWRK